jgi:DNA-directed RNA polymerase specialized sigma24 family protein
MWVAALDHSSAIRNPGAWLRKVALNLALRRRRDEHRREALVQQVATTNCMTMRMGAGDARNLPDLLARHIAALEEPYRTALHLRYVDGEKPGHIAAGQCLGIERILVFCILKDIPHAVPQDIHHLRQ